MWLVLSVCWVGFAVCAWLDPRRLRAGLWLLTALGVTLLIVFGRLLQQLNKASDRWQLGIVIGVTALMALAVLVLAAALIGNGVTMARREGHRLPNLLAGLAGLGLLAYAILAVVAVIAHSLRLVALGFVLLLPIGYLGFTFLAFVLYAGVYQLATKRFSRPAHTVVVLGSGLIRGRVPPLLASRLDTGRRVWQRSLDAGNDPVLVVSGGQGSDEPRPEAEAMAEYLIQHGVPAERVVAENRSRTTEQNLANTPDVLISRGLPVPVAHPYRRFLPVNPAGRLVVVTSNYHAFRAATLLRTLGLPGQVIGAPTARYYWPSATIREFIALMRDHWVINLVCLVIACVPLIVYLGGGF